MESTLSDKKNIRRKELLIRIIIPISGVLLGLLIGAFLLIVLKANPLKAYGALFQGAMGSTFGITQTLVKATPLLLVGLGISIAFRASCINIGEKGR
jgi:ABC-type uncharacterized transport system permease subunit